MSEEEDKNTLNDADDGTVAERRNNENDTDNQSDSLLVNVNENTLPCQLDIGLGTHTDSRRDNDDSNANGKSVRSFKRPRLLVLIMFANPSPILVKHTLWNS